MIIYFLYYWYRYRYIIIETETKKLEELQAQITNAQSEIDKYKDITSFKVYHDKMTSNLSQLEDSIIKTKKRSYDRDTEDYAM